MAHRPGAIAFTALGLGLAVTSCAFQPNSSTSSFTQKENQPVVSTGPAGHERKTLSAVGSDSDCVMTTSDIHLWCKWISRYY